MIYTKKINNGFDSVCNFTRVVDVASLVSLCSLSVILSVERADVWRFKHWFLKANLLPPTLLSSTLTSLILCVQRGVYEVKWRRGKK